ncbi:MAG: hypothetical protein ACREFG_11725 [Chthoniobacterales bacterium]
MHDLQYAERNRGGLQLMKRYLGAATRVDEDKAAAPAQKSQQAWRDAAMKKGGRS